MQADRQTLLTCRNRRVGETTRAVRDRRLCFVVPVSGEYARMARALGNSVRYFHPHSRLVAVTTGTPPVEISVLAESGPFDEVVAFEDAGIGDEGYSAVIWTKLQVMSSPLGEILVILDADMLMYRRVDALVEQFERSGKLLAATLDDDPILASAFKTRDLAVMSRYDVPALCACLIIVRPSSSVSALALAKAREINGRTRWPEQAALSAFAAEYGGWCELDHGAVIQSRDREVLNAPRGTVFIHVGSPRPETFGASPLRWDEMTLSELARDFRERWGQPFPVAKLCSDFEMRLNNDWA